MIPRRVFLGWAGTVGYGTWALLRPPPHRKAAQANHHDDHDGAASPTRRTGRPGPDQLRIC